MVAIHTQMSVLIINVNNMYPDNKIMAWPWNYVDCQ